MATEELMHSAQRNGVDTRQILSVGELYLELASGGLPHPVLRDISLSVDAGEFVVVFGPSGSGKSSLLRLVAGLVAPTTGVIEFNAKHLRSERSFGFVFQEARLLPWRRVTHNVQLGLEGLALSREERRGRAEEALSLVGLARHGSRWPSQLSGGQRQRVGTARALAVRPDLLLMDEPFSSLDAVTRRNLQVELLRVWEATGTSILFVTHDLEEAILLADRLVLLAGNPGEIIREYRIDDERPRDSAAGSFRDLLAEIRRDLDAVSDGLSSPRDGSNEARRSD